MRPLPDATPTDRPLGAPARVAAAWEAPKTVVDPELPVLPIVELGLVREVAATDDPAGVRVAITPTFTACPAWHVIEAEARAALERAGLGAVTLLKQVAPPWSSDDMTEAAREKLERRSKPNIRFLGYQPDDQVARLLGCARAFVCAAREDFGIAVVEAQAAGCPVIAYRAGGVLETVAEGETGLFSEEPSPESLAEGVRRFETCREEFLPGAAVAQAARFNPGRFLRELADFVEA